MKLLNKPLFTKKVIYTKLYVTEVDNMIDHVAALIFNSDNKLLVLRKKNA